MPPQEAAQEHVQGFRSVHKSQPPSTTTVPFNSPKVVHIDCYTDPDTNRDFILWEDIQQAFSEALSVRNRTKVLPFAKGEGLRALEPRRIAAVPDVVLDVVVGGELAAADVASMERIVQDLSLNTPPQSSSSSARRNPAYGDELETLQNYNHMDASPSVSHHRGPQNVHDEYKDDGSNALAEKVHQPKAITKNLLDPQDNDDAAEMGLMQTMINANSGGVQALFALGDRYKDGREDNAKAFKWFHKAALQGYADAQAKVSQACTNGAGVPKDNIKAMRWSVKAAKNGHAGMQCKMVSAYEKGQGVPQSDSWSFRWYLKSADQGFAKAQERVAAALEAGRGVSRNGPMAVEWYTKAADQGLPVAQFALGRVHKLGLCSLPKDWIEAVDWFIKAAVQGHTEAQSMLNELYSRRMIFRHSSITLDLKPHSKIKEWFMDAADQGVAHAQVCMEDMYRKGFSVRKDESKAFQWYLKAAEQGHETAQGIVARMYDIGLGTRHK
ncbi:hypothetical protein EC957_002887 [Mortierella hygrophila]|uniref:HCP-like protein n=1 Tax=Mortierella hygrophila TaxID=979708 RepID=A0A9P6F4N1_9FUNG|nr:hypothetical protein EC957_002887 [Mortierella hygrophila]